MSRLDEARTRVAELAARRAQALAEGAALGQEADGHAAVAQNAASLGDVPAYEEAQVAEKDARSRRREALGALGELDGSVASVIAELIAAGLDPCDAEPEVPLVLLPVRLETRYSDDGGTLRVRIYPDDVHVDRLDPGVSDAERAAGAAYWKDVWAGGAAGEEKAWNALVAAVHPERAGWVAAALTPRNLADRPQPPAAGPDPDLPDQPPRLRRPAVARALPDRFVVVADQGGDVSSGSGSPVRAELIVGLSPDADPATLVQHGELTLGEGMTWMADPGEATDAGMLVEVPLAHPDKPVDRVIAVGVRSSLDPAGGAAELSRLLTAHRYTAGAAFVPQGTPTNNTETDRAAWTRRPEPSPPPTAATSVGSAANAGVAAAALGIDPSALAGIPYSDREEQTLAHAAHTALFSPSWGTFFDRVWTFEPGQPWLNDFRRQAARTLWEDHVRGRGPLPALRVGDQPYGLLPVSSVDGRWKPDGGDPLEPQFTTLLRRVRTIWRGGLGRVPAVGEAPLDETLLEILGSAPQLLGLRVRSLATRTSSSTVIPLVGLDPGNGASQQLLDAVIWQSLGFERGTGLRDSVGATTRPLGLPLVAESDPHFIAALLAEPPQPRTIESVLQALLELAYAAERAAIEAASPAESAETLLRRGAELAGDELPRLQSMIGAVRRERVAPDELAEVADRLHERFGPAGPSLHAALQPVAAVRGSMADIALSPALREEVAGRLSLSVLGAWFRAHGQFRAFRDAADALAAASMEERRIAVAEALDCASHRFDAWTTALPARRLDELRAAGQAGVMLGAYGWVENLVPGAATTREGGYIHAPSMAHAATAGVLRSGYLTHNPDLSGSGALAVDLSSARIQRAQHIVDGVREGQPLGALLGYRLERLLHDDKLEPGLNRFVLSLRALAPIVARKLSDRVDAMPEQAQESISANNVVDGVRLLTLPRADIRTALEQEPKDNPYLEGPWKPPTDPEWNRIEAAIDDIADAYDAASDLLLAEAVHQLTLGNTARAAAALDGASAGDAMPVEPSVIATPTRGVAVGHRVLVVLPASPPGSGGWAADTPRAAAEPRLAAWAETRLGPATDVVVHVAAGGTRTMLDAAGLSAVDFVYDAADPAVLERRLRRALPQLGDDPLQDVRDPGWPTGLRAIGEVAEVARALARFAASARPALPESFSRPNDQPSRLVDLAELSTRVTDALALLKTRTDALGALLETDPVDEDAVGNAVAALGDFGIELPDGAMAVADAAHAEASRRVEAATALVDAGLAEAGSALSAGHALFGDGFPMLPTVGPGPSPDLYAAAFGAIDPGTPRIRRWLRDVATVRAGVARYSETLLFADGAGVAPSVAVAQLAPTGTPGASSWLGLELPDGPSPDKPITSIVVETPAGYGPADAVAGLVADEWADQLPRRTEDGQPTVTTGLAVHANGPNARAPQSILLAISPDGERWTTEALVDVLTETLELAKLRAVTLERSVWAGRILPALQEQSWSLQGEETLDIKFLATVLADSKFMTAYVKETDS